jgi:hypothetical protein
MKKILSISVLAIALFSCKKSGSGSPVNSITATIADTVYTFNQNILDTTLFQSGTLESAVIASDQNLVEAAVIFGTKSDRITTTTYGHFGDSINLAEFQIMFPNGRTYSSTSISESPSSPFLIDLTSFTTTHSQGTFTGTVYLNGDTTSTDKKVITNGSFNFTNPINKLAL